MNWQEAVFLVILLGAVALVVIGSRH